MDRLLVQRTTLVYRIILSLTCVRADELLKRNNKLAEATHARTPLQVGTFEAGGRIHGPSLMSSIYIGEAEESRNFSVWPRKSYQLITYCAAAVGGSDHFLPCLFPPHHHR
jgi:hypothetical protein